MFLDECGEFAGTVADVIDECAESGAAEGFEGDGDFEGVGAAGGAQGAAEQVGEAGFGVVVGVEVVGVVVQGCEVAGVLDGEDSGGDRLPAEFVQVEGDGVGGCQSGELGAVALAEQEGAAVRRVDVESCAVGSAECGDVGEGVDESGVGGARGGCYEDRAGECGEGLIEGGGIEGAGGRGYDDGGGQAEQPGGAGQRVVGVATDDQPHARAVCFAGEEEGELVGFGAAGGDEGVGVVLCGVGCGPVGADGAP